MSPPPTQSESNNDSNNTNSNSEAPAIDRDIESESVESSHDTSAPPASLNNAQTSNNPQSEAPGTANSSTHPDTEPDRPPSSDQESVWPSEDGFLRTFTIPAMPNAPFESFQESFAERVRHYLSNRGPGAQERPSESRESQQDTLRDETSDHTHEHLPGSPTSMNIFDDLLDTVMGTRPGDRAAQDQNTGSEATASEDQNANGPADSNAASSANNGTVIYTTGQNGDQPGAIVITVNYTFMDGANEPAPGRTGSLVVTIPNNATNREPHIISSFISLATRMAYSALIHTGPKRKPGVTLEKFQSFKSLNVEDLTDRTCAVCFEQYESPPAINVEDLVTTKKRKLSPTRQVPSGSATPEQPRSATSQVDDGIPPSTVGGDNTDEASGDTHSSEQEQKVYLCDHQEDFDHSPLQMPCKHVFGRSCLAHWLKDNTSCPLCRTSVSDTEDAPERRGGMPAISFIRFGGLDDVTDGIFNTISDDARQSGDSASEQPHSGGAGASESNLEDPGRLPQENEDRSESERGTLPNLLRRATSVIFNQSSRRNREAPPPPLDANGGSRSSRDRNPTMTPMIHGIQNYFRRARRHRDADGTGSHSLFASGVASRRTPDGVETVASDSNPLHSIFTSANPFTGSSGASGTNSGTSGSHSTTSVSNSEDRQQTEHGDQQDSAESSGSDSRA
ncbi:hypothetical protein OY671_005452 [Metschnikowia pulcherrima]|nr:hypothetical protein OY671_005452 [Metschnikowia pulcherrima]